MRVAECSGDILCVAYVRPNSPAAQVGVARGDHLLGADGFRFGSAKAFGLYVKSHSPGDCLELLIRRGGASFQVSAVLTDVKSLHAIMGEQGRLPAPLSTRHRRWMRRVDDLEQAVDGVASRLLTPQVRSGLATEFSDAVDGYAADCRLDDIDFLLQNPLKATQVAVQIGEEISASATLASMLTAVGEHLDLPVDRTLGDTPEPGSSTERPVFDLLSAPLRRAQLHVAMAYAELTAEQRRHLLASLPKFLDVFSKGVTIEPADSLELARMEEVVRLAKRVHLHELTHAAAILAELAEAPALDVIRRGIRRLPQPDVSTLPNGCSGDFLYAEDIGDGWILVGGPGANIYATERAAAIIDLGGDDVYDSGRGSSQPTVQLVIDLAGNDHYRSDTMIGPSATVGGVSVAVDFEGDDTYIGQRFAQGSAVCGVGVLDDRSGDDRYAAESFAHGSAFFGIGILRDHNGSDRYTAGRFAQGFGSSRGFGLLFDNSGDDEYVADNVAPSSYGTAGVYEGWAQGVGCGVRGFSSGGIGILLDRSGRDEYRSGNFGQGTGYFFGFGALIDGAGDDRYVASRYGQGAAAHQAVGVLVDLSGDDYYSGRIAASQGGAWDTAIGILEDRDGDDRYEAEGFAQAAAALTGFAVLFDWKGRDSYTALSGQAQGSSRPYCGSRGRDNLAALIDRGNDVDHYEVDGRGNSMELVFGSAGMFSDR